MKNSNWKGSNIGDVGGEVRFLHGVLLPGCAVGMGALGDEGEPLVLDDGHIGAVGAAEDLGCEDLGGRTLGDDAAVETDDPG